MNIKEEKETGTISVLHMNCQQQQNLMEFNKKYSPGYRNIF